MSNVGSALIKTCACGDSECNAALLHKAFSRGCGLQMSASFLCTNTELLPETSFVLFKAENKAVVGERRSHRWRESSSCSRHYQFYSTCVMCTA